MVQQINPQLLQKWKKDGEILILWRCERCFKKFPFYKTDNSLVNSILLSFARNERYCSRCRLKNFPKKKVICKTSVLLERYEGTIMEEDDYF